MTNAVSARALGTTGSPLLPDHVEAATDDQFANVGWIVMSPRGPISQYPPGTALLAAPLYAVWGGPMTVVEMRGTNRPDLDPVTFPVPPLAPAALTAASLTALAAGLVALMARAVGATSLQSVMAGCTAAFATGYWSVSSNQLWQHGPASAAVAGAVYSCMTNRRVLGGLGFAVAILIRPHLAIIAAVVGLGLAASEKSFKPLLQVGLASGLGLAALLAFNWWAWGELTVSGGYRATFTDAFLTNDMGWYAINVARSLIDPARGVLVASPFFLFLIPGLRQAWRGAEPAVRYAALGSMVYMLVQLRANRFSGGDGHFAYRYPLEPLTASAPLLFLAFKSWVAQRPRMVRYFGFAVVLSAVPQLVWAVLK